MINIKQIMNQTDNEEELRFSQETDGGDANTQWKGILSGVTNLSMIDSHLNQFTCQK